VNAFEVIGIVLIVWAIVVGVLGITRENFPATTATERLVGAISVILVLLAIGSALYTGATEEEEEHEEGDPSALIIRGA
jgi:formate-dependent nitrite reductase membrane component NrfD